MRVAATTEDDTAWRATMSGVGYRDAESLFRSKPISEIRSAESTTRSHIQQKQEELRLLVGTRYRDLIDSADSILRMQHSASAISSNLASIHSSLSAMSDRDSSSSSSASASAATTSRSRIYGVACRVKYLVDTPENIWACLDESMFLEAAARFVRSKHLRLLPAEHDRFPLLQHHSQMVDGFRSQISQRARDRLFLFDALPIDSYADALAAVAVVDDLPPVKILSLFLDSRKAWASHALAAATAAGDVASVFCDVLRVIQLTVAQVGELFLRVLSDMPLFHKVVLGSPPVSQLFGGIPDPEEEVKLWNRFREKLESEMVTLEKSRVAEACAAWVRECGAEMVGRVNGRFLIDGVGSGRELAAAETVVREAMESKEVLRGSLEWLKNVFGSDIELPWSRTRELVLGDDSDLWDDIFEDTFVGRMKDIVNSRFGEMARAVKAERESGSGGGGGGGSVWFLDSGSKKVSRLSRANPGEDSEFKSCLDAYLGPQISGIRDAVDGCCQSLVEDLLCFLESPKASVRLQVLAPYLQSKCYESLSTILKELKGELHSLDAAMRNAKDKDAVVTVERALFIGRLLFAFLNHSTHVPVVLGPPRFWVKEAMSAVFDRLPSLMRRAGAAGADSPTASLDSPGRRTPTSAKRQTSLATTALLGAGETASPQLEDLTSTLRELCIKAHGLWISWLSVELSTALSRDLGQDEALSSISSLRGWEETVVKQVQSDDNPAAEMKILLPSLPSLYVESFLFRACEEVHRIGGHVLDRAILQKFALTLLEKVISIYGDFISTREGSGSQVSEKGILQILLDLRFVADVLSGGDSTVNEESLKVQRVRNPFRRKPEQNQTKSVVREQVDALITRLSERLDPIDWLTYEPYLWENEKQSYQRHAVLFGFFVQLSRMYTDTVQKLSTNSESNIMRCSAVPRFKYLPISAPALSSRGTTKASVSKASEDISSRSSWKAYANGELSENIDMDDDSSFGVATPFLKSFMQVGSKFGGSTLKLGSILTDGQVGIFKDRSTAAMSTFGDILPAQAAGLLSSFTAASKSDS